MSASAPNTIIRKRRKRRRRRAPMFPFVLLALILFGLMGGGLWFAKRRPIVNAASLPDGYVGDEPALKREYAQYYGTETELSKVSGKYRSAAELASKKNFPAVASVLESIAKLGGVPVIYHDLGVAYASLGDLTRSADAFREALARDPEYPATRKYLRELKPMTPGSADPYTREVEPNGDARSSTLIALRTPVGGEITGNTDTADYFRLVAPAAPRDLIAI